jgi:hypothetical protein
MKVNTTDRSLTRLTSIWGRSVVLVALAIVGLIAAACGVSNPPTATATPDVAASTPATDANPAQLVPTPTSGPPVDPSMAAFASCMRSNGVPEFPDPNSDGSVSIRVGSGSAIDPSSPLFQSADETCSSLRPPQEDHGTGLAQGLEQGLLFSSCMREHDITDFPDPELSGGTIRLVGGASINPNSPTFQAAMLACQALLPGGGH